jgi:hypothetical protein
MPVRKTTRTKKTKEAEPVEDGPVQEINEEAVPSPAPVDQTASKQPEGDSDRQLFFSTDGDEPEQERTRPSDDAEEVKSDHTSSEQVVKESKEGVVPPKQSTNEAKPSPHPKNPANQGGPQGQGQKKLTWQEKKKLRRKQKFKKPRRLPYEETETKPLEIGQLLDFEEFKTEEGIEKLLQPLLGSGKESMSLDDYLALNLLDLTEKVSQLKLEEELPNAPLREELIDLVLGYALNAEVPVTLSGIIQVMEDGHGFYPSAKRRLPPEISVGFCPERLVRKYGLKTGHWSRGYHPGKNGRVHMPGYAAGR